MNYVIKTGKTVEEAVNKGLEELNLSRDKVEIEVLEEPSKGFLGLIGSKEATVKVSEIQDTKDILNEIFNDELYSEKKEEKESKKEVLIEKEIKPEETNIVDKISTSENVEDIENITKDFILKVMQPLGLDYDLDIKKENNILNVNILGEEEKLGIVIGKRGATLDAIQYLLSLMINKDRDEYIRVNLDSSGYRKKRENTLSELAEKMANKVLKTNRPVKLEPMNSSERRIIHASLQGHKGITTYSEGKDPYRRVVIQKERKY